MACIDQKGPSKSLHRKSKKSADLVPVLAIRGSLADLAMQAVGEGGDEGPRHEGGKASLVEGLGGGQGHGSHCTPMEGTLHAICACSEQQSMLSTTEDAHCSTTDEKAD